MVQPFVSQKEAEEEYGLDLTPIKVPSGKEYIRLIDMPK